ncbi:probable serine/threonine-protein kinase kinX isoform X3 [Stylophora pistillata]|uniref:probable serine/threonine-protein kinase kinX isoform X3 n=1 Tax=Stylophora pistillata TaxID=50429 RepID=UPI000C057281|nr:probable serine/threonine-protein kinase kinX isoform X3 [Stylophora pistillata]
MMDADTSGHSDISICSDDTEFLLGQNISIREIDDDDVIQAHESVKIPSSVSRSYHLSPQPSPQKLQQINSSNLRSPQRKGGITKPGKGQDVIPRSPGHSIAKQFSSVESSKSNIKAKADKKSQPPQNYTPKENLKGQTPQTGYGSEAVRYSQDGERTPKSKKQVPENFAKHPHGIGKFQSPENHKSIHAHQNATGNPSLKSDSLYKPSQLIPPLRDKANSKRKQVEFGRSPLKENYIPGNQNNWEIDSEISLDLVNGDQKFVETETNDLESQMSEATEDLVAGQDGDEEDFTEKLKELNLAVNYDADTNEYFDDKVREGAELLSKLFGGQVDNYYSSSSMKRQPLYMQTLKVGGQSKSSGSASVQEVSRSDSHLEERRTQSHTSSTTQRSLQQSISPQVQSRTEEQNSGTLTDQSSSFESSVSTSARRRRAAGRKEVRFRDEMASSKEIPQRDHHVATDGEFIQETSAFRAAMNYDDDDDDDDDDDNASDNTEEQRKYYYNHTDKMNYTQNRRVIPVQNQDELGTETVHNYEPSVKSKSSSKQQGTSHHNSDEGFSLQHKNRTVQRFNVEKFSDSGTSRRLDYQDNGPVPPGFMTSTPHKKFEPVFSSPKAFQTEKVEAQKEAQRIMLKLQENERKLNRSLQEVRDVEFELEEAASRKKIALQELQVLEETITRNKAEVNSSENLVEQYRQQATKTRSQLMDLELQRDNIQHEIKELRNCLAKQKQESEQVVEVEKRNELKVLELSIERDQIQSEVESLRSQLNHADGNFAQEKQKYVEKLRFAQDQLQEEHRTSKESVEKLKQQLEDERQKARDSHYERINAIHKLQDESKEMHEKEIEVLKNRFVREKEMELETLREKTRRDTEGLNKKLQEQDHTISHLQSSLKEYEEEITKLKTQVLQEQKKLFDCESEWKENLAKQDTHVKSLRIEIDSLNENEACLHENIRRTEQLLEEKILELKRHEEKSSSLSEELKQVMKNKDDEITMLRGLVRQQEDATRLLGEKLRNEAQEHIRNALEKERESTDRERARHQAKLEEIRDKYESALKQVREELETERQGHHHLHASVNKIKKEIERLRELNLKAEQEKVNAVAHVRSEAKEEIVKMRDKLQELTALAETSEKETAMELTEECRKTAALLGDSANTTPVRNLSSSYVGESPRSTTDSPAREALLNLRSYNEELRQHLIEARKELEQNKKQFQQPGSGDPLTPQQVHLFKKTLIAKDEEIARGKRQLQEESERNALQIKSERTAYQKTIDRLEKELKQAKAATPAGSPMINGTSSPPESGVGTSLSSTTPSPRPGEDSSTARLLRHLQGRVQQLRAQNDSLRKSSENESLNDSHCSVMSTESFNGGETEETKRLHAALKTTEDKAQRNAAMLSQKMMEMTKLQKMLTHATKENMKLERAYAALQRKIIDNSR